VRFSRHGRIGPLLRLLSVVVVSLTSALFRREWRHLERIPRTGPAILAVNHVSYADPFVIARLVWDAGRIPRFLGKAPLFEVPVVGPVLRGAGQIPVRRATREAADSLQSAVDALHRGEIVVIYPEGTVTRDDDFWPMVAKTGVARLALLVPAAPLIPVAQWGSQDAVDWYHRRFRPLPRKSVTISIGHPVDITAYSSDRAGVEVNRSGPAGVEVDRSGPAGVEVDRSGRARGDRSSSPQTLRALTDLVMTAVRDELAGIRGLPAPETFTSRPPASVRKVSMPADRVPGSETAGSETAGSETAGIETAGSETAGGPAGDGPDTTGGAQEEARDR
jgi:1-acyl-sn-glycerol-3-phosphate acyltransferase